MDYLIVLTAERFTSLDLEIGKEAKRCGIPAIYVRTKSDIYLQNMKNKNPSPSLLNRLSDVAGELKRVIKNDISSQLQRGGIVDHRLFIVSTKAIQDPCNFTRIDEDAFLAYITAKSFSTFSELPGDGHRCSYVPFFSCSVLFFSLTREAEYLLSLCPLFSATCVFLSIPCATCANKHINIVPPGSSEKSSTELVHFRHKSFTCNIK